MTEFFLILLTFTQIPVFFIFSSRVMGGLITFTFFKKNPEWVIAHSEFNRHRLYTRVWLGFSYLLAALTFIAALKFTLITPMENLIRLMFFFLAIPMTVWGLGLIVYWGFFYLGIVKKIPAPARREASLASRQLSTYVPLWVVYFGYGFLALILIAYTGGWMSGAVGSVKAIDILIRYSVVAMAVTVSLLITVRQKHTGGEQIFGSGGRKAEVIITIGILYLALFAGLYQILTDFFSITLFAWSGFAAAIILMIQVSAIWLLLHPKVRSLHREYRETYLRDR